MALIFYVHASLSVAAMGLAMLTSHVVHALLYAVTSLLCLAVAMYCLSAEMAAALEVIVYAGAIMVLFVFAIMLLRVKVTSIPRRFSAFEMVFSSVVLLIFWAELSFVITDYTTAQYGEPVTITDIGRELFGTYGLLVEAVSFVLLAGLTTAIFITREFTKTSVEVVHHDSP